jgi:hypothetical protein
MAGRTPHSLALAGLLCVLAVACGQPGPSGSSGRGAAPAGVPEALRQLERAGVYQVAFDLRVQAPVSSAEQRGTATIAGAAADVVATLQAGDSPRPTSVDLERVDVDGASYVKSSDAATPGRPWRRLAGDAGGDRAAFLAAALLDPAEYLRMSGPRSLNPDGMFPTSKSDTVDGAPATRHSTQCQLGLGCRLGGRLQAWLAAAFPDTHFLDVTLWLDRASHLLRYEVSSILIRGGTQPQVTLSGRVTQVGGVPAIAAPPAGQVAPA